MSREERLRQLVTSLLHELSYIAGPDHRDRIVRVIRGEGMGWALPESEDHHDPDHWVTIDQLAYEFGYTAAGMRTRLWRSGLTHIDGLYRWADVNDMMNTKHGGVNDNRVIS